MQRQAALHPLAFAEGAEGTKALPARHDKRAAERWLFDNRIVWTRQASRTLFSPRPAKEERVASEASGERPPEAGG